MSNFIQYGDKKIPMHDLSLEDAKEVMARHFPELADPQVEQKKTGEDTVYVFTKKAGRKGAANSFRSAKQLTRRVARRLARQRPIVPVPAALVALVQAAGRTSLADMELGAEVSLDGVEQGAVVAETRARLLELTPADSSNEVILL